MKPFFLTLFAIISVGLYAQDITPPVAVCKNITLELDQYGIGTIIAEDLDGGSSDDVGIVSYTASQTDFDCYSYYGNNTVTLTITDAAGNSSSCDAIVTVIDVLPPPISAWSDDRNSIR